MNMDMQMHASQQPTHLVNVVPQVAVGRILHDHTQLGAVEEGLVVTDLQRRIIMCVLNIQSPFMWPDCAVCTGFGLMQCSVEKEQTPGAAQGTPYP